jgi:hypothetical protein
MLCAGLYVFVFELAVLPGLLCCTAAVVVCPTLTAHVFPNFVVGILSENAWAAFVSDCSVTERPLSFGS